MNPQQHTEQQNPNPGTRHLHGEDTPLHEHESQERFKLYLIGRTMAYEQTLLELQEKLENVQKYQVDRNSDENLWSLAEGQSDALDEMLHRLSQLKEMRQTQY